MCGTCASSIGLLPLDRKDFCSDLGLSADPEWKWLLPYQFHFADGKRQWEPETCQGHTAIRHSNQAHAQTFQQQISRPQPFAWIKSSINQEVLGEGCRADRARSRWWQRLPRGYGIPGRQKRFTWPALPRPHLLFSHLMLLVPVWSLGESGRWEEHSHSKIWHHHILPSVCECSLAIICSWRGTRRDKQKRVLETKNNDVAGAGGKGEMLRQPPSHTKMKSPLQLCLKHPIT